MKIIGLTAEQCQLEEYFKLEKLWGETADKKKDVEQFERDVQRQHFFDENYEHNEFVKRWSDVFQEDSYSFLQGDMKGGT